jgi:hypothetical protein
MRDLIFDIERILCSWESTKDSMKEAYIRLIVYDTTIDRLYG